jgi:hypothetical protein
LFGLVAFPDAKLGWFPFGSVAGRHIIDREKPAAILATGPPFTALLLGVRLKAHGHVPLVVDFRDQWPTGFAAPPRWQRAPLRHVRRYVLRHADLALAVNAGTARAVGPGVQVLDNGFDPTDFEVPAERLGGLSVVHVGNAWRNEQTMLAFADALRGVPEARLYLAGAVGAELQRRLAGHPQVRLLGPLPHRRCMALLKGADALLYVGKPGQPAGIKLYEYIGARRPVLVWGSGAGEAVDMVVGLRAGCHCGEDGGRLSSVLATLRSPGFRFAPVDTGRFDRRAQARWLAGQLERLVVGPG